LKRKQELGEAKAAVDLFENREAEKAAERARAETIEWKKIEDRIALEAEREQQLRERERLEIETARALAREQIQPKKTSPGSNIFEKLEIETARGRAREKLQEEKASPASNIFSLFGVGQTSGETEAETAASKQTQNSDGSSEQGGIFSVLSNSFRDAATPESKDKLQQISSQSPLEEKLSEKQSKPSTESDDEGGIFSFLSNSLSSAMSPESQLTSSQGRSNEVQDMSKGSELSSSGSTPSDSNDDNWFAFDFFGSSENNDIPDQLTISGEKKDKASPFDFFGVPESSQQKEPTPTTPDTIDESSVLPFFKRQKKEAPTSNEQDKATTTNSTFSLFQKRGKTNSTVSSARKADGPAKPDPEKKGSFLSFLGSTSGDGKEEKRDSNLQSKGTRKVGAPSSRKVVSEAKNSFSLFDKKAKPKAASSADDDKFAKKLEIFEKRQLIQKQKTARLYAVREKLLKEKEAKDAAKANIAAERKLKEERISKERANAQIASRSPKTKGNRASVALDSSKSKLQGASANTGATKQGMMSWFSKSSGASNAPAKKLSPKRPKDPPPKSALQNRVASPVKKTAEKVSAQAKKTTIPKGRADRSTIAAKLGGKKASAKASSATAAPVLRRWTQNKDGTITGIVSNKKGFSDGTTITTSPVKTRVQRGTVVTTDVGSKYDLR
jgi:hypothetical protein